MHAPLGRFVPALVDDVARRAGARRLRFPRPRRSRKPRRRPRRLSINHGGLGARTGRTSSPASFIKRSSDDIGTPSQTAGDGPMRRLQRGRRLHESAQPTNHHAPKTPGGGRTRPAQTETYGQTLPHHRARKIGKMHVRRHCAQGERGTESGTRDEGRERKRSEELGVRDERRNVAVVSLPCARGRAGVGGLLPPGKTFRPSVIPKVPLAAATFHRSLIDALVLVTRGSKPRATIRKSLQRLSTRFVF